MDLWVSYDGGIRFFPQTSPCKLTMQITGRVMEP